MIKWDNPYIFSNIKKKSHIYLELFFRRRKSSSIEVENHKLIEKKNICENKPLWIDMQKIPFKI